MTENDAGLVARLKARLGPKGWVDAPEDLERYVTEWRKLYRGATLGAARPASTEEVADVVALCAAAKLPIVPQSGNTGLVGGGVPPEDGRNVVLSLERMTRIREVDGLNFAMTVEAGCILADIQAAAADHDRLFPLSLGAEGTCRIGGNLSTNAGGIQVLRYGNARDLVLGLEVVLPDGRVWDGLSGLRKDNTGYDLKQLFVGAEGTLGIITAATLKLFPRPRSVVTALLALGAVEDAMAVLARARAATGDRLTAFELMPRIGLEFALRHVPNAADPLAAPYPWYVLIEVSSGETGEALRESVEAFLGECLEAGLVQDGVIAASAAQTAALWLLREGVVEGQVHEGGSIKHDVSVPVSKVATFIRQATAACEARLPGVRVVAFGHVGDGNIHFNLSQPVGADRAGFLAQWDETNRLVHDLVAGLGGSISAEHGIGRMKRAELRRLKSPVALDLMARIKSALDPDGIMNPGKVI